jgi:prepilin-type N-terminal cleavage/methylation domain-containing protein
VIKKLTDRKDRAGFTLVEMLVVVLIIALLAGLISAAAIRARNRGKVTAVAMEINQLSMALQQYKAQFGEYPPDFTGIDQVRLGSADLAAKQLVLTHISKAFPHLVLSGSTVELRWRSLRTEIANHTNPRVDIFFVNLNPSTALRFWLGGMSDAQGRPIGFSKDPAHPFDNTTPSRIGPFFEFDPDPLRLPSQPAAELGRYYPSGVVPGNGQPYVYLRAELGQPQPKREYYSYIPGNTPPYLFKQGASSGAKPYWDQRTMGWVNPESFQILCCGLDGRFGQENVYPTGNVPKPFTNISPPPPGETFLPGVPDDLITDLNANVTNITPGNFDHIDDQTNFTSGTIGDDLP